VIVLGDHYDCAVVFISNNHAFTLLDSGGSMAPLGILAAYARFAKGDMRITTILPALMRDNFVPVSRDMSPLHPVPSITVTRRTTPRLIQEI
jgi:hypothetical protein